MELIPTVGEIRIMGRECALRQQDCLWREYGRLLEMACPGAMTGATHHPRHATSFYKLCLAPSVAMTENNALRLKAAGMAQG